jgi:hypothetical protein
MHRYALVLVYRAGAIGVRWNGVVRSLRITRINTRIYSLANALMLLSPDLFMALYQVLCVTQVSHFALSPIDCQCGILNLIHETIAGDVTLGGSTLFPVIDSSDSTNSTFQSRLSSQARKNDKGYYPHLHPATDRTIF